MGAAEILDGSNEDFFDLEEKAAIPIAGLVGSAAGLVGGAYAASKWDATWGDGEVVRMGGLVGASWGLAASNLDDNDAMLGLSFLGYAAGLAATARLDAGRDFTPGQAVLVDTGSVAGALLGLGIVILTDTESDRAYMVGAASGATAGFAATLLSAGRRAPRHDGRLGALRLEIDPAGLLDLTRGRGRGRDRNSGTRRQGVMSSALITLRAGF
jgi:hypothetical protein